MINSPNFSTPNLKIGVRGQGGRFSFEGAECGLQKSIFGCKGVAFAPGFIDKIVI
jgi:hypothetical protein